MLCLIRPNLHKGFPLRSEHRDVGTIISLRQTEKEDEKAGRRIEFLFLQTVIQKQNAMSDNYNIFKVLNFKEKETIHSAMIAAIASHDSQSRNEFFKMLKQKKVIFAENPSKDLDKTFETEIDCLTRPDSIDFNSKRHWIDTEVNLSETVNREGKGRVSVNRGRADIWIGTNKKVDKPYRLIIENKINAGNQYHQLRRYYRYLTGNSRENAGLFFLCPIFSDHFRQQANESAEKYNNESKVNDKERSATKYAIITYKEDIVPWLKEVKKTAKGDFRKVVNDYYELVVELVKIWEPNWEPNKD